MYAITYLPTGRASVIRLADNAAISPDPKHPDRIEFKAWNAKQAKPLDTSDRVIEQPAPVKPDADLETIVAKVPEQLLLLLLTRFAKDHPDEMQGWLAKAGLSDTVREGK